MDNYKFFDENGELLGEHNAISYCFSSVFGAYGSSYWKTAKKLVIDFNTTTTGWEAGQQKYVRRINDKLVNRCHLYTGANNWWIDWINSLFGKTIFTVVDNTVVCDVNDHPYDEVLNAITMLRYPSYCVNSTVMDYSQEFVNMGLENQKLHMERVMVKFHDKLTKLSDKFYAAMKPRRIHKRHRANVLATMFLLTGVWSDNDVVYFQQDRHRPVEFHHIKPSAVKWIFSGSKEKPLLKGVRAPIKWTQGYSEGMSSIWSFDPEYQLSASRKSFSSVAPNLGQALRSAYETMDNVVEAVKKMSQ